MDPFIRPTTPRRYPVEIRSVREVMLIGRADLAVWRQCLQPEALTPFAADGAARLVWTALSARWLGYRFCECSLSVAVSASPDGATADGFRLLQAYNDSKVFAWVERTFFGTPYDPAQIDLSVAAPWCLAVRRGAQTVCLAEGRAAPASSTAVSATDWEGPIFIAGRATGSPGRFFFARFTGAARQATFEPEVDRFSLGDVVATPVLGDLTASGFVPHTWQFRASAIHGRTATFDRLAPDRRTA